MIPTSLYGKLIRTQREKQGKSLDDMALGLDMTVSTYQKLEAGTRPMTVRTLERVADFLEIPVSDLIPSLAGKYNITGNSTTNYDNGSGNAVQVREDNSEAWQAVIGAHKETIAALQQTIVAQANALEALKMALEKRG